MKFTPRPYQHLIRSFTLDHERCSVFASPGMGKTSACLESFASKHVLGEANRCLVLAPKRVALTSWPEEVQRWSDSFGHLSIAAAVGTPEQRYAAIRSNPDILTINYESVEWLMEQYGDEWPFDMVIADECFVAGTPVITEVGDKPIESVLVGEKVLTRRGYRRVNRVYKKSAESLVEVRLVNGARFVCTKSHRVWTENGWKNAARLEPSDLLCSAVPTVRFPIRSSSVESRCRELGKVLSERLCDSESPIKNSEGCFEATGGQLAEAPRGERCLEQGSPHEGFDAQETQRQVARSKPNSNHEKRWKRSRDERVGREAFGGFEARVGLEPPDQNKVTFENGCSNLLQARFRLAFGKSVSGSRWDFTQGVEGQGFRHEKNFMFARVGVESVSSVELRSPVNVYDLEVEGAHEYFASGVRVHNCTRLKGLRVSVRTSSKGKEFIAGQGSSRAKALASIAHRKVRHWINATGSPAPNGLVDLWGQQWFVDGGRRLGHSFTAFQNRWFRALPGGDGYSRVEPLPHAQAEIESLMRQTSITVEAKDWFPLEEVIERNVFVDLPPKARSHYRDMEKNLFTELAQGEVEVFNAGSKTQKCLQIASGIIYYDDERNWAEVHSEKIDALKSIFEETNGENLLVAYQHRADLARILKAFPKARELDANPKTLAAWNRGEIRMLVCHPASAGHGLSLQHGGRILVDFSTGWNLEYDEQVIERIGPTRQAQSGYERSVFRYRIVARDTLEQHSVIPRLKSKMSVQDALKAAMKVRA